MTSARSLGPPPQYAVLAPGQIAPPSIVPLPQYGQLPEGYRIVPADEPAGGGSSGPPTFHRKVFRVIAPDGAIVASDASESTALAAGLTVLYYRPRAI